MILRDNNYLKGKKKKHLTWSIIWLGVMFSIFFTGLILNKTRGNLWTVVAAVLVLPVAQYATQFFAILKFYDPEDEISRKLETIQGDYNLFHSVIIPHQKGMINFDHVIVTGEKIYCIVDREREITHIKDWFNKKVVAKGISLKTIVYVEKSKSGDIGNLIQRVEASAQSPEKNNKEEYTKLIIQMMM